MAGELAAALRNASLDGSRKINKKLKLFFSAYVEKTGLDGKEAARIAGYKWPDKAWLAIRNRYSDLLGIAEQEFLQRQMVSDVEVDAALAHLVRNPLHRDHIKACELVAKMRGRLDTKVTVVMDRTAMLKELDIAMKALATAHAQERGVTVDTIDVKVLPEPAKNE